MMNLQNGNNENGPNGPLGSDISCSHGKLVSGYWPFCQSMVRNLRL